MESACPSSVEQSGGPAHKSTSLEPAQGEEKARLRCGDRSQGRPPGQGKWGPTMRHLGAGVHALIRMVAAWPGSFAPSMELDVQKVHLPVNKVYVEKTGLSTQKAAHKNKVGRACPPSLWLGDIWGGGGTGGRRGQRKSDSQETGQEPVQPWVRAPPNRVEHSPEQGQPTQGTT